MMDDESLWLPFCQTKDALFMALLHPSQPIHWQTPSGSPAMRDAHRKATNKVVSALQAAESKLEALQKEVKEVQQSISRHRVAAQNALAPVALLPPELIREIVDLTVLGPWDCTQILKLSHVSRLWRDVVLQHPALFSYVDFLRWPLLMIETWFSRSSERHLLEIELDDCICKDERDSRLSLLWSLSTRIGGLSLSLSSYEDLVASGFLSIEIPRLRRLHVEYYDEGSRNCRIELKNMPSLRILSLENVFPEIPVPLSGITDLIYYTTDRPLLSQQLKEILSKLPNLRHICLKFREVEDTTLRIRLPLISLELVSYSDGLLDVFRRFTVAFPSPNLQSLTLTGPFEGYYWQCKCYEIPTYVLSLASQMSELRVLRFVSVYRIEYLDRYILPFTHTGPAFIFPDLEVLEFRGGASKALKEEGLYELFQRFVLARKGKITRLVIPPLQNRCIMDLLRDNIPQLRISNGR